MLLGVPVEKLLKVFSKKSGMSHRETLSALERCEARVAPLVIESLAVPGKYLLTTPSLNFPGGAHSILLDFKADWSKSKVYDPNVGIAGAKVYYTGEKIKGNQVPLVWWSDPILILDAGHLPKRR